MKNYLSLTQASNKINNLCKAVARITGLSRFDDINYVRDLLKVGHKVLWISKLSGLPMTTTPKHLPNFFQVKITWHEDKYELEIV